MNTIESQIEQLLAYALQKEFITADDWTYCYNKIAAYLQITPTLSEPQPPKQVTNIGHLLDAITAWAVGQQLVKSTKPPYSDLFQTALMDIIVPRPGTVRQRFEQLYQQSPKTASDWYYQFSQDSDYIKTNQVAKNLHWQHQSPYGTILLTINLSKPEKDPKAIALAAQQKRSGYPTCLLCAENEGYAGNLSHPARQTHRIMPLTLAGEDWFMQYSPYVYYNEHTIIVKRVHEPMLVNHLTFERLFDYLDYMPHYFIGSNAGLPIVGGSMLAHDHYQGGHFKMPMVDAKVYRDYGDTIFDKVSLTWLNWPLTALRLRSKDRQAITAAAAKLNDFWQRYSDPAAMIIAKGDQQHNAITPIARMSGDYYEIDMVLRNNLTNDQYPDGIYHPHPEIHPVKKENIGLIEVLGCAILPGRLKQTLDQLIMGLEKQLPFAKLDDSAMGFESLYQQMLNQTDTSQSAEARVWQVIGDTFVKGLTHAGVIQTDATGDLTMQRLIDALKQYPSA